MATSTKTGFPAGVLLFVAIGPIGLLAGGCGRENIVRPPARVADPTSSAFPVAASHAEMLAEHPGAAGELPAVGSASTLSDHSDFYPLTIGNRWHYAKDIRVEVVDADPGLPTNPFQIHARFSRELIGTERLFEREYVVEETVIEENIGGLPTIEWIRYRQDRSGLYEADVGIGTPPVLGRSMRPSSGAPPSMQEARAAMVWEQIASRLREPEHAPGFRSAWNRLTQRLAAMRRMARSDSPAGLESLSRGGGPLPNEITRLRYPLRPGQSWTIREDPLFDSSVEAVEVLNPTVGRFTAYRIRIESVFFGPDDRVQLWYGRAGYLGRAIHAEGVATDEYGNPVGRVIYDEAEALDGIQLVAPGERLATQRALRP